MKSKQYYSLYKQGTPLEDIFRMMVEEVDTIVEMRGGYKNGFPRNAIISAYKDQNNKAKSIFARIFKDTQQLIDNEKFISYVYQTQGDLATWVFPNFTGVAVKTWLVEHLVKVYGVKEVSKSQVEFIRKDFQKYIDNLNLSKKVIADIFPKQYTDVLFSIGHPTMKNGLHPALELHFIEFVQSKRDVVISV